MICQIFDIYARSFLNYWQLKFLSEMIVNDHIYNILIINFLLMTWPLRFSYSFAGHNRYVTDYTCRSLIKTRLTTAHQINLDFTEAPVISLVSKRWADIISTNSLSKVAILSNDN